MDMLNFPSSTSRRTHATLVLAVGRELAAMVPRRGVVLLGPSGFRLRAKSHEATMGDLTKPPRLRYL